VCCKVEKKAQHYEPEKGPAKKLILCGQGEGGGGFCNAVGEQKLNTGLGENPRR